MAGPPEAADRPARAWDAAALLLLCLAAWINMRGWLDPGLLPPGDFAGYAAVVEQVRDALLRHGRVPTWCSACFGGSSYFVSSLKETLAFPLAVWLDPVSATKALFAILRVVSAFLLYWLFARRFAVPAVGIAAAYVLAFGTFSNHQVHALDVPVSAALLAAVPLAALPLFERGSWRAALVVGFLAACLLANNWVQALVAGVLFLLVGFAVCGRSAPVARLRLLGVALATCLAFSASWLAWTFADSGNHQLIDPANAREQRALLSERSPFLLLNRDSLLSGWLDAHDPFVSVPSQGARGVPPISASDGERRYLGAVAIAIVIAGALLARRVPALRRWLAAAALLLLFQYWMALGPHTLVWEVGRTFGFPGWVDLVLRLLLGAIAIACLLRRRFGLALVAIFPALPLWEIVSHVLPPLAQQRSPGHFIDLLPFAWALLVGVSLVAIARRVGSGAHANALVVALALLLAIDYWPSRRAFEDGSPLAALEAARDLVAGLPGEDGSLRMHLIPPGPGPSFVASGSQLGWAHGWLGWQAGRGWLPFMNRAGWPFHLGRSKVAPPPGHARLLEIARIRYLLMWDRQGQWPGLRPQQPWLRVGGTPHFSLWEQPHVGPMARGYRAFALVAGERYGAALALVAPLHQRNLLVASVERLDAHPELADAAALVFSSGLASFGEAGERIAERLAHKLVAENAPSAEWRAILRETPPPTTFDVTYERPAPEHIHVSLDAGGAPAQVFVSEGYHPWWRATVDSEPAPVLRAQAAFLAVPVPAGAREVDLRFTPPVPVRAADALTRIAWLAVPVAALLFAVQRLRARPQTRSGAPG